MPIQRDSDRETAPAAPAQPLADAAPAPERKAARDQALDRVFDAVHNDDVAALREEMKTGLVKHNAVGRDGNYERDYGQYPLLVYACKRNAVQSVELLLGMKANPNATSRARPRGPGCGKRYVDAGSIHATPLLAALCCWDGHQGRVRDTTSLRIATMLLDAGADAGRAVVRPACLSGSPAIPLTPLRELCSHGHKEVVNDDLKRSQVKLARRLLAHDTATYPAGESPLRCAASRGNPDLVRLLLPRFRGDLNARNEYGYWSLGVAVNVRPATDDHIEVVRILLAAGASPEPPWPNGQLYHATAPRAILVARDVRIIDALLKHGAETRESINAYHSIHESRYTVLSFHLLRHEEFYKDVAQRLVDAGANVNADALLYLVAGMSETDKLRQIDKLRFLFDNGARAAGYSPMWSGSGDDATLLYEGILSLAVRRKDIWLLVHSVLAGADETNAMHGRKVDDDEPAVNDPVKTAAMWESVQHTNMKALYDICCRSYLRRRKRAEAAARNFAFQWLEKVHVKKGAAAPMLQLNTEAHHEAVNEELSHIASGGCFTSGRLGGEPPAKRLRA